MSTASLPVVLLAFANNRVESRHYLRNLPEEHRRIREILGRAQEQGLCEVVDLPNATTSEIIRIFQQPQYRNRVAIFHFGGHASGFSLMLEDAVGKPTAAGAVGLAQFLGVQKSLQLVFLNGCSTLGQTEGLLNAGVGAVISTSTAINDEVATSLACRFYEGLATGADLQNAFTEATSAARMEAGESTRALYAVDDVGELVTDQLPWHLTIRPGAEPVARWNLPLEAKNPLFGLPPLPALDLEPSPFRNIRWFQREHAELFFGRGEEIRDIYLKAISPATAPIILFYGQAGTGKSSLLDAGLLPRLEQTHTVGYHRRDQQLGLAGTLRRAVTGKETPVDLGDAWRARESASNRPLTLVLDQIEELYSSQSGGEIREWKEFQEALLSVFRDSNLRPRGRLILAFRKEWLAEIRRQLSDARLPFTEVFLEDLSRSGIIEAVHGPTRIGRLRNQYNLTVESGLAEIIADDLLDDKTGTNAPTLQVLLTRFWEIAFSQNPEAPTFSKVMYSELKKDGILLGDFLDRQLKSVNEALNGRVHPDLLLDLLSQHTTPLGMSNQCRVEELRRNCPIAPADFDHLIRRCLEAFLLISPQAGEGERGQFTRLSHDTLGPLIRQRFATSDLPGQRARRILESRSVEWKSDQEGTPLDDPDLKVVESGREGMRSWTANEQRLVHASQRARSDRRRGKRILKIVGAIAVALIVMTAYLANWQRNVAIQEKRQAEKTLARSILTAFQERPAHSVENLPLSEAELGSDWELASSESEKVREDVLRQIASDPRFGERVAHRAEILTHSLVGIDLERRARMLRFISRVFAGESPATIAFDEPSIPSSGVSPNGGTTPATLDWKTVIGLAAIIDELQPEDESLNRATASELVHQIEITTDPRSVGNIAMSLVKFRSHLDANQTRRVYEHLLNLDLSRNSDDFPKHIGIALIELVPALAAQDITPLLKLARQRWDSAGSGLTLQQTIESVFVELSARVPQTDEVEAWKILSQSRRIPAYMGAPPRWNEALIHLATRNSHMAELAVTDMLAEYDATGPKQLQVIREAIASMNPDDLVKFQERDQTLTNSKVWQNLPPRRAEEESIQQDRARQEAETNLDRGIYNDFQMSPGDPWNPTANQIRDAQLSLAFQLIDRAMDEPNEQTLNSAVKATRYLQAEDQLPVDKIQKLGAQLGHLFNARTLMRDCEPELTIVIVAGQPFTEETAATMMKLLRNEAELPPGEYGIVATFGEAEIRQLISQLPEQYHPEIAQIAIQASDRAEIGRMRLGWINLLQAVSADKVSQEQISRASDLTSSFYRSTLEGVNNVASYELKEFPSHPQLLTAEHRIQLASLTEQHLIRENNCARFAALCRIRWNLDVPFADGSSNTVIVAGPLSTQQFIDRLCHSLYHLPPPFTNSSPPMKNTWQPGELAETIQITIPQLSSENRIMAANAAFYVLQHADFVKDSGPQIKRLLRAIVADSDNATIAMLLQSPWCIAEARQTVLDAWTSKSKVFTESGRWKQLDFAQKTGLLPSRLTLPTMPAALVDQRR